MATKIPFPDASNHDVTGGTQANHPSNGPPVQNDTANQRPRHQGIHGNHVVTNLHGAIATNSNLSNGTGTSAMISSLQQGSQSITNPQLIQLSQPIANPQLSAYLTMATASGLTTGGAGHIGGAGHYMVNSVGNPGGIGAIGMNPMNGVIGHTSTYQRHGINGGIGHTGVGLNGGVGHGVANQGGAGHDVLLTVPPGVIGVNDVNHDIARMSEEGVQETVSEEVFSSYKASISIPGARIHPGDIVQAASLSDVPLPSATYDLAAAIPPDIITSGKLSSLQLEGVLYACQRHQRVLSDGNRAGFFIGDAAGVGKGRQISAIILDNYVRGRTKHIWFSISSDLKVDAQRDMNDLGCHIKVIEGCQHLDKETRIFGLPSDFHQGVIFSTYATLVSSVSKGSGWNAKRRSRLDQLIKWCGGDKFDGCLIFDECHKAKHFVPGKESSSTKVAVAVTSIQRMLPNARVVYCSATGVTDVKNMAFMERLGLWGTGAPFKSFDHFLEAINRRGLGVAEMLAMEMKASGMYVARGLSFRQAEFVTIETQLDPKQVKMYDVAAHVWNELRKALESAIERTNTSSPRVWSSFWSCHQRFFKQLCLGVKVPAIVNEAKQALADGFAVVIGLQTTGEASLESEMGKADNKLTDFVSIAREILIRFINQHFPTQVFVGHDVPHRDDEWCVQAKTLLMGFATKIELPNSPLDEIIDQLGGTSAVAEMTGRRGRMVRVGSIVKYELRSADNNDVGIESLNVKERNSFMEGRKLIAVISDAASTGISLHSDMRVANQKRRVHLTIELPWSADKAVQQLGRSHRSNQSSGPMYRLLTTNLGGERRFAASVAKRLQSLGALTQGDRRAASGADLTQFNFDTNYGRSALRSMYSAICTRTIVPGVEFSKLSSGKMDFAEFNTSMQECLELMGVLETGLTSLKVSDKDECKVSKFLNRILGISVKKQNLIFNYFFECLQNAIATAKKEGKYSEGLVDIKASSVQMLGKPKQVFQEAKTSTPTYHMSISVDRGMTWEQALTRASVHSGSRNGFYRSKKEHFGRHLFLLATQKPNSTHFFRIARPNTGISAFDDEISDLLSRYNFVTQEKAEKGWKDQYDACKTKCIHGKHCKNPQSCTIGSRCYRMDLLSGGIVTLMATLENTIARFAGKLQLSKASYSMKVVRVELTGGERTIGIRYPAELLDATEDVIKESKVMDAVQTRLNIGADGLPLLTRQVTPDPVNHARIDPESPVNPKLVNKAMTAQKTIRSFFKVISESEKQAKIRAEHEAAKRLAEQERERLSQVKGQNVERQKATKGDSSNDDGEDCEAMVISDSESDSGASSCKSSSLVVSANIFKPKTSSSTEKQKSTSPFEKRKSTSPCEKQKSTSPAQKQKLASPTEKRKSTSPTIKQKPTSLTGKRKSKTTQQKHKKKNKSKSDERYDETTDEEWCPDEDNGGSPKLTSTATRRGLRTKPRMDYAFDNENSGSETPKTGESKLMRKCKTCKKSKRMCACKPGGTDSIENDSIVLDLDKTTSELTSDQTTSKSEKESLSQKTSSAIVENLSDKRSKNTVPSGNLKDKPEDCIDKSSTCDLEDQTCNSIDQADRSSDKSPSDLEGEALSKSSNLGDKASTKSSDKSSSSEASSSKSSELSTDDISEVHKSQSGSQSSSTSNDPHPSESAIGGKKRPLTESNAKLPNLNTPPSKKTKTVQGPLIESNAKLPNMNTPPSKKTKTAQGNMMIPFVKKTESKLKKMICPLCQKTLPAGTTNEQMNTHVDRCLQG